MYTYNNYELRIKIISNKKQLTYYLSLFLNGFRSENIKKTHSTRLLAPLISKLPSAVQGRVLKVAGKYLL